MSRKKLISLALAGAMTFSLCSGNSYKPITVKAADTKTGLIAQWNFDENYEESVAGLKTIADKPLSYTEGVFGKAIVFNGKEDGLTVTADTDEKQKVLNLGSCDSREVGGNTDQFTISAWVNLKDSGNKDYCLLDKGNHTGWQNNDDQWWPAPYELWFSGSAPKICLDNCYSDTRPDPNYETKGSDELSDKYVEGEEWFLLTVTYDATATSGNIKTYIDGKLLQQKNYKSGIAFNYEALYIGTNYEFDKRFQGYLDDLRFYNRTLDYSDIEALYQEGVAANPELLQPTKQLVAYYNFDQDLNDSSVFKNHAQQIAIGGETTYVEGACGNAAHIEKGTYLEIPAASQLNFEKEFTISFWAKEDYKSANKILLYRQNPAKGTSDNDNDWTYKISLSKWNNGLNQDISLDTQVQAESSWTTRNGVDLTGAVRESKDGIGSDDWYHSTFTYKDGIMKYYLNGILQKKTEDKVDYTDILNASGSLLVGFDGSTFFEGSIDELKMYNKALDETEVKNDAERKNRLTVSSSVEKAVKSMIKGTSTKITGVTYKNVVTGKETKVAPEDMTFSSTNQSVVVVEETGKIKAVGDGEAKIRLTYGGYSVVYPVKVYTRTVSVDYSTQSKLNNIKKGKSFTIKNVLVYTSSDRKTKKVKSSNSKVTFKSSKPKIFTVTNKGKIVGKKKGKAKLTITYDKITKVTYQVTIK